MLLVTSHKAILESNATATHAAAHVRNIALRAVAAAIRFDDPHAL
jgi:hypothetical protein